MDKGIPNIKIVMRDGMIIAMIKQSKGFYLNKMRF